MRQQLPVQDAISALHKKGFTSDFRLLGKKLFWLQGKQLIPDGSYEMRECFRFITGLQKPAVMIIYSVIAFHDDALGILIDRRDHIAHLQPDKTLLKYNSELNGKK